MDGMWRLIRRKQTEDELSVYREHLEHLVEQRPLELKQSNLQMEREIADRKRMEARLVQTEKLAMLGLLSAGVAHEINNPLAYVANNLAVLERDFRGLATLIAVYEDATPAIEVRRPELVDRLPALRDRSTCPTSATTSVRILDSTRQGVKRVADIVKNLRGFARLDQAGRRPINLSEAIDSLEMLRGRLPAEIAVEERSASSPSSLCACRRRSTR